MNNKCFITQSVKYCKKNIFYRYWQQINLVDYEDHSGLSGVNFMHFFGGSL